MYNDIFISYRNDIEGKAIGRELKNLFEESDYSAYFNPDEQKEKYFPDELRSAVLNCKDFLMLITNGYLQRILEYNADDWICKEIQMAHENKKNIIPILVKVSKVLFF